MTPQEIAALKTQSDILREALKTEPKLWRFLREGVKARYATIGFVPLWTKARFSCDQCACVVPILLGSPYNTLYPGWCIECVLQVFQASQYEEIEYYEAYRDPKSPKYDAEYAASRAADDEFLASLPEGIEWA